jgi:predicted Fe-Mo cluster-binding NifX family protein
MKIAISAKGNELSSLIDPRFGRAAFFIIYSTEDGSYEAISNEENASAPQGAGVQAAQSVTSKQVDWVISGNMGPKALSALRAAGVKIASWHEGTVKEAVMLAQKGELKEISGANVQGHWR